ncbi:recombinase family protein [Streptomyces sp. NPDC002790]|uniref:recombinase family protein n=1 Tax=Streptomyces sp. NPDC002790 TaxID=3154431 RepID=UPI0033302FFA
MSASGRKMNMRKDPGEWPVLREMIDAALAGHGWNSIARDLNHRGVPTASGKTWSGATVRQALTNPVMCGYRFMNGELVTDPATGLPVIGKWDTVATPAEWRALVDISQQNGAQRGTRLTNGSRPPAEPPTQLRKYLFSGFLRCGADKHGTPCRSRMGGCARPTAQNPDNVVYVCASMDCGGTARSAHAVDAHLSGVVARLLSERGTPLDAPRPRWEGEPLLFQLVQERHVLTQAGGSLEHADVVADLSERISGLEETRSSYLASSYPHSLPRDPDAWPTMSLHERRAAIADVIDSVVVLPLPPGTSRRAPFDPDLLQVVPKQTSAR